MILLPQVVSLCVKAKTEKASVLRRKRKSICFKANTKNHLFSCENWKASVLRRKRKSLLFKVKAEKHLFEREQLNRIYQTSQSSLPDERIKDVDGHSDAGLHLSASIASLDAATGKLRLVS